MHVTRLALAAAFAGLLAVAAHAETKTFHAMLDGASEVPAKTGAGKGMLDATLDTATKELSYTLTYSDLSGPASMAHFHGPAAVGANAGVLVPIPVAPSPIKGTAKLTDAQISDLESGKVYVNIHTKANPGGEIRGQVMAGGM
jgi:hypothetical protein